MNKTNDVCNIQSGRDAVQHRRLEPEDDPEPPLRIQEAQHEPRHGKHAW